MHYLTFALSDDSSTLVQMIKLFTFLSIKITKITVNIFAQVRHFVTLQNNLIELSSLYIFHSINFLL